MIPSQEEIDARLARYAMTLDASVLWPEVTARAFRAAQDELARTTAAVLADPPAPIHLEPPGGADAHALGVAAFAAGMGPLLGFWRKTGRIAADPAFEGLLAVHLDQGRRRVARLGSERDRVVLALADRSIEATVLKGIHTAFEYFPDPGTRPMADVDLLVRPEDGEAARAALRSLGYGEHSATVTPDRSYWTPPGVLRRPRSLEIPHADDPWSLDLHLTLDREFFPGLTAGFGHPGSSQTIEWNGSASASTAGPRAAALR